VEQTFDREQLVRYLLGDLPEDQQASLEKQYLAHAELFEELVIVENELADRYADGTLSRAHRSLIEERWMSDPRRARKIAFAGDLRRYVEGASHSGADVPDRFLARAWKAAWRAWLLFPPRKSPAFRPLLAVLTLVIAGSGAIVLKRHSDTAARIQPAVPPGHQLTSAEPTTAGGAQTGAGEPDRSPKPGGTSRAADGQTLTAGQAGGNGQHTRRSRPAIVAFVLGEGLPRDVGVTNELKVPRGASTLLLRLDIGSDDHMSYEAAIGSVDGAEVWSQRGLRRRVTTLGTFVDLKLSSTRLPSGDYLVSLHGASPGQPSEEVAHFYFRLKTSPASDSAARPR
jgi:hypothetical protein